MAKYKIMLVLPFIIALVLVCAVAVSNSGADEQQQQELMKQAADYAEDKIYVKALPLIIQAYGIETDITDTVVEDKLIEYYNALGYYEEEEELLLKRVTQKRASEAEYLRLIEYYLSEGSRSEALDIVKKALLFFDRDKLPEFYGVKGLSGSYEGGELYSDEFTECFDSIRYEPKVMSGSYDEIGNFYRGYFTVKDKETGRWAVNMIGRGRQTGYVYDSITNVSQDGYVTVHTPEDGYTLVNAQGVRYAVCKNDDIREIVRTENNGRVVYLDSEGLMHLSAEFTPSATGYEYIGASSEGIRALRRSGRWYFFSDGEKLFGKDYDEILTNSGGESFVSERAFVRENGSVCMIDKQGSTLGQYENARPFDRNGLLAAVCIDGKWGFADRNGTVAIECRYEDAYSFSASGLGAVKESDEKWRLINVRGEVLDGFEFDEAQALTDGYLIAKDMDTYAFVRL